MPYFYYSPDRHNNSPHSPVGVFFLGWTRCSLLLYRPMHHFCAHTRRRRPPRGDALLLLQVEYRTNNTPHSPLVVFLSMYVDCCSLLTSRPVHTSVFVWILRSSKSNHFGAHGTFKREPWTQDSFCDCLGQCIIFVHTRDAVDRLAVMLEQNGHTVSSLHGRMEEKNRDKVLADFRAGVTRWFTTMTTSTTNDNTTITSHTCAV